MGTVSRWPFIVVVTILVLVACGGPEATPTLAPGPTPAATPTATPSPTAEITAAPSLTPVPVPTPTGPLTPTPTPTLTATLPPGVTPPNLVKVADLPGGDIMDIEFVPSNPNVVYLLSGTNAMGAWRSDDAGETWRKVLVDSKDRNSHTISMAVHPTDPDVVLVSDAHLGIIKTEDGGLQWKRVYPHPAIVLSTEVEIPPGEVPHLPALAFSPSLPSVAYAGGEQGNILKSTDGGDNWQTVAAAGSGEIRWLAVDPRDSDTLYAGGKGQGLFKSTDGGQSWEQVLETNFTLDLSIAPEAPDLLFAASPGAGVFKSTDGGATWRLKLDIRAHSVQVAPSDPDVVYAGTSEGVFKSVDGGETWLPHSEGMEYLNVGRLTVHPADPNTVLAGSTVCLWESYGDPCPASTQGEGVYRTTDGGLSWAKNMGGFVDTDAVAVAVDPNNSNLVYVSTLCSRGLYQSEDGGASWAVLRSPTGQEFGPMAHYGMRLAVTADSVLWLTAEEGFAGSADGGQTWEQPLGGQKRHIHGIGVSPHDPNLIFVGTAGGIEAKVRTTLFPGARILRSTDGGRSWEEVGSGFPSGADSNIHDIIFDPFDPKVVYVATTRHEATITVGIYKSTDGGETWMPANNGLAEDLGSMDVHEIVASPATRGLLYAGTRAGVYRSSDGGGTWVSTGFREEVRSLLIDPVEPHFLYAGTDFGLFWSADGGDTWQRLESVPAEPVTSLAIDARGNALYAAVNGVGIFKEVKS